MREFGIVLGVRTSDPKRYLSSMIMIIRTLIFLSLLCCPSICLADELRVGALLSLSGDYAALGTEINRGIELAQAERGGTALHVEVVVEDIQTLNNRAAVSAAQK